MDSTRTTRPASNDTQADVESKVDLLGKLLRRMLATVHVPDTTGQLTPTQLALISLLEDGPRRVGVLAAAMGGAQNTISEVVARLERARMVRKKRDPDDLRAVLVEATERGMQALEERRAAMNATHRNILQALSVEDRQRFVDAFELLAETAERSKRSLADSKTKP